MGMVSPPGWNDMPSETFSGAGQVPARTTKDWQTMRVSTFLRSGLALMAVIGLGVSLSACNTTEGFGKDVKNTGGAIEKSAQDNKPQ